MITENQKKKPGCFPILGVFVSILYLANLSAGLIEIPDNLPLVGNLDEVFFSGLLFASLSALGIRLPFLQQRIEQHRSHHTSDATSSGRD